MNLPPVVTMKTALRILCLAVSTWLVISPTTAAQPPAPPKVPIDVGALDVVVKKDTKEKLKGRIRFATTDSINSVSYTHLTLPTSG